jgi:biopolymer transport protein TolQ
MNPTVTEFSIVAMVMNASLVVKLVMAILVAASVTSWAIILRKRHMIVTTRRQAEAFEATFWASNDLGALFRTLEARKLPSMGTETLFEAGFREFSRLRKQAGIDAAQLMEGAGRSMKAARLRELERLEANLEMLATVGSISPYIGLFGTVWGIMHAFIGLGNVQQATLQAVAPAIAEALIATAIGLFAAIPAVVAYNRFSDQVFRIEMRLDTFVEEFSTILQRHAAALKG